MITLFSSQGYFCAIAPPAISPDKYKLEAQVDGEFSMQVLPWIMASPALFVEGLLINPPTLWFITHERSKSLLVLVFQTPLVLGDLWGLWVSFRRQWNILEWHMLALMGGSLFNPCSAPSGCPIASYFSAL